MKSINSVTAITFLFLSTASAQLIPGQTVRTPLYSDLSRTYGFILGQRISLNRIRKEYPDLSAQAQKAELEFQAAFGNAERNINDALREIAGEEYSEFMAKARNQLESMLSSQLLNRQIAANIIAEVELRAKGEIPFFKWVGNSFIIQEQYR